MGLTSRELFAFPTVLRRGGRLASSDVLAVLELRGAGLNASAVMSAAAQARKTIDLVDGIFVIVLCCCC